MQTKNGAGGSPLLPHFPPPEAGALWYLTLALHQHFVADSLGAAFHGVVCIVCRWAFTGTHHRLSKGARPSLPHKGSRRL